ncbi:MAG TPA: hypothetical protein VF953_07525, partial [Terriglobales bacterium]
NAHRSLAWGVLGLATGGLLFSLLTLLFSGVVPGMNPFTAGKFRGPAKKCLQLQVFSCEWDTSRF